MERKKGFHDSETFDNVLNNTYNRQFLETSDYIEFMDPVTSHVHCPQVVSGRLTYLKNY